MQKYNDIYLVTDKIQNFKSLLKQIPFRDRIIVEVFGRENYIDALKTGIKYPLMSLSGSIEDSEQAIKYSYPIIAVNAETAFSSENTIKKLQEVHNNKITIFVYYVGYSNRDTPKFIKNYVGKTFSKVYTDKWAPDILYKLDKND